MRVREKELFAKSSFSRTLIFIGSAEESTPENA